MAPTFAAGSITGEKERKTYEMLLASPLEPMTILVGKLLSSLSYLILLILSSAPLVILCFLLGGMQSGVTPNFTELYDQQSHHIAYVVAEKADAPGLVGPARALSIRAHNDIERGLAAPHPDGDVVWVSPADILARRSVPVPRPVRDALRTASTATVSAASTAAASAMLAQANRGGHRPAWLSPSKPAAARAQEWRSMSAPSPDHGKQPRKSTGGTDRSEPVRPLR